MSKAKTVGERIRETRERIGLSQEELAKRMGYTSKAAISKAELHSGDITTAKVEKFAKALGVSFEYLMGWEDGETSKEEEDLRKAVLLMAYIKQLNDEGFAEALKRVGELSELSKYKKDDDE